MYLGLVAAYGLDVHSDISDQLVLCRLLPGLENERRPKRQEESDDYDASEEQPRNACSAPRLRYYRDLNGNSELIQRRSAATGLAAAQSVSTLPMSLELTSMLHVRMWYCSMNK